MSGGARGGGGQGGGFFGPGSTGARRYSLTFSVYARNVLNHVNLGTPGGVIGSPFFDQSYTLGGVFGGGSQAANRRIDVQAVFSF